MLRRSPGLRLALPLLLLLACGGGGGLLHGAGACTSYIAGRDATIDGVVIIARNDDGDGATTPSSLVFHPARDGPAVFRANLNNLTIELPAPGLAYFALPDGVALDARNTSGEAAGWNAAGVAVSATESIYNSAAALAADPHNEATGVIEDAIPSILLPQATSARHGAALLGALVSERGAGEAFGVLLADEKSAWYLETASGHHWLAQRVPDHAFFISANQGRFQDVDLEDEDNVMASPGLLQFAVDAGLFDPSSGRPFNFFEAFMRDGVHDTDYSYPRVCLLQHLFGACDANCNAPTAPVFMPPAPRRLTPQDVMAAMRNHWDGTQHDPYLHKNPDEPWRPIALLRTGMGHVTVMRPRLGADGAGAASEHAVPDGLSVITYTAMATPKFSPFIPLYKGLPGDAMPPELAAAPKPGQMDGVSIFWRVRRLQALIFQDYSSLAPAAADAVLAFERRLEGEQRPAFEREYAAAVRDGHHARAEALLVDFTHSVVQQAAALLDGLAEQAARALGFRHVPCDKRLLSMLEEAAEAYAFEPTSDPPPSAAAEALFGTRPGGVAAQ